MGGKPVLNKEHIVNEGLEHGLGGWIRQQDTDFRSETIIDEAFIEGLYKELGLVTNLTDGSATSTDDTGMLHLTDDELQKARTLVKEYAHLFAPGLPKLQPVTTVQCDIETEHGQKPLASSSYPLAEAKRQFMRDTVLDLLSKRIIPWASPVVIARKKGPCNR